MIIYFVNLFCDVFYARLINEKIESLAVSLTNKTVKEISHEAQVTSPGISNEPLKPRSIQLVGAQDQSAVGVELVQVKEQKNLNKNTRSNINGIPLTFISKLFLS